MSSECNGLNKLLGSEKSKMDFPGSATAKIKIVKLTSNCSQ